MAEEVYQVQILPDPTIYGIEDPNAAREGHSHDTFGTSAGFVPASTASDANKYLKGNGTWDTPSGGSTETTFKRFITTNPHTLVNPSIWETKTWSGLTEFHGIYTWTDGTDIYYSYGTSNQYVLDKATSTWKPKTWNGLTMDQIINMF